MVELGNINDIKKELRAAIKIIKEEKNNDVRLALYNYVGNLYSGISVIKGHNIYPHTKKIFGSKNDYQRFIKSTNFLMDKFNDNFIRNKAFHLDFIGDILVEIESIFIQNVSGNEYSEESDYFGENDFFTVYHDFCQSLGLEHIFKEMISERRILKMKKGKSFDNFCGLTLHNPVTGRSNVLIDAFDYNLDSMFTLAHETGHYYDLLEFNGRENISDFISYTFKSMYQEVVSRLFEKLFLNFLSNQKIMNEKVLDKLIDSNIINHDYILSSYIISLLDDEFISKDRYMRLSAQDMTRMVSSHFEHEDAVYEYISTTIFNLMNDISYAYGDILSLFLKENVLVEGLDGELMKKFNAIRHQEFNPEFLISEEFTPVKYSELYSKEVQLIKK